jgi:hypothetical protein
MLMRSISIGGGRLLPHSILRFMALTTSRTRLGSAKHLKPLNPKTLTPSISYRMSPRSTLPETAAGPSGFMSVICSNSLRLAHRDTGGCHCGVAAEDALGSTVEASEPREGGAVETEAGPSETEAGASTVMTSICAPRSNFTFADFKKSGLKASTVNVVPHRLRLRTDMDTTLRLPADEGVSLISEGKAAIPYGSEFSN